MSLEWTEAGPRFGLEWGGRQWTLAVDSARPGLTTGDGLGPVLSLLRVKADGRSDFGRLDGSTLRGFERRFDRVEATYAPEGWGSLVVRAAWRPRDSNNVDLEVQIQAGTVDELQGVEIHVGSDLGAHLADDSTGPLVTTIDESSTYVEIGHPDDVVRRTTEAPSSTTYALFGYDMEKGVVVRGRLRGLWLAGRPGAAESVALFAAFLREPLPLGV